LYSLLAYLIFDGHGIFGIVMYEKCTRNNDGEMNRCIDSAADSARSKDKPQNERKMKLS